MHLIRHRTNDWPSKLPTPRCGPARPAWQGALADEPGIASFHSAGATRAVSGGCDQRLQPKIYLKYNISVEGLRWRDGWMHQVFLLLSPEFRGSLRLRGRGRCPTRLAAPTHDSPADAGMGLFRWWTGHHESMSKIAADGTSFPSPTPPPPDPLFGYPPFYVSEPADPVTESPTRSPHLDLWLLSSSRRRSGPAHLGGQFHDTYGKHNVC